jgi:hypothetical protein
MAVTILRDPVIMGKPVFNQNNLVQLKSFLNILVTAIPTPDAKG